MSGSSTEYHRKIWTFDNTSYVCNSTLSPKVRGSMKKENYILLKIAQSDLKAAKILYGENLYPQAVFFLHQSIEKAVKQIASLGEIIDDVKEISHAPLGFFEKAASEEAKVYENLSKISEAKPELEEPINNIMDEIPENYEKTISKAKKQFKKAKDAGEERIFVTEDELNSLFEYIDEIRNELEEGLRKVERRRRESDIDDISGYIQWINDILDSFSEDNPEKVQEMKNKLEGFFSSDIFRQLSLKTIEFMKYFVKAMETLRVLALIMPYEQAIYPRYPNSGGDHNPLEVYTEDLPIIKRFNELSSYLETTLEDLDELRKQGSELEELFSKVEI